MRDIKKHLTKSKYTNLAKYHWMYSNRDNKINKFIFHTNTAYYYVTTPIRIKTIFYMVRIKFRNEKKILKK